jgi:DNA-binding winged helix-turn-helix (wHTH) protein
MSNAQEFVFPPFRLDIKNALLWREAQLIPLRPKTFAVLSYLVDHAERIVSHIELSQAVWGHTKVSPQVLRVSIRELRHALQDTAQHPRCIETIAQQGWRFIAPVAANVDPVSRSTFHVSRQEVVTNLTPARDWAQPQETREEKPETFLVGREKELAWLHERLAQAHRGERQFVFVTGEPGIGKTTLIDAFLKQLKQKAEGGSLENSAFSSQTSGVWIARGQCIEHYGIVRK